MTTSRQPVAATMFSGGVSDITPEPTAGSPCDEQPTATRPLARPVTTEAGRYLRAAARFEPPSRYDAEDDSAARTWEIAFGLAARMRFESNAPLAEIGRTVATAMRDRCATAVPLLDAEMLVRHALGEKVPVDELDAGRRVMVHLLMFATLADELALGDSELDTLIAEAEELAAAGR